MNFQTWFHSRHPQISNSSAEAVLRLASEGGTVPFIARYRKEQTGNLDEVAIQNVIDAKEQWDTILKRQTFILQEIESQQKLTPDLKTKLLETFDPNVLEDLYLPYKQKRKAKATLAKEAGLQPLADWIWDCAHGTAKPLEGQTLEIWAFTFRNEEKGFNEVAAVISGAQDILIERLSETQTLRSFVREALFKTGHLISGKGEKAKPNSKYERYFTYSEAIPSLLLAQNSHRYLAIRRGWIEGELTLAIGGAPNDADFEARFLQAFETEAAAQAESPGKEVLQKAARLALKAHVLPSIEKEAHRAMKEIADGASIQVFSANVRKLLLASPFGPKAVLGVDPGIRTGCKLALVDMSGKFVGNHVIMLQTDEQKAQAKKAIEVLLTSVELQAIAVGNGTGGRETETFFRATLKELSKDIPVVMISEAGASVYSASEAAREEFAELDLTVRGAISIARRLQDPLAELVKVDPRSIGVGQYQHDVAPNALRKSLEQVVDSCVNSVGVNLNTASYHLLSHVSGIGEALAKAIVERRGQTGLFRSRTELLDVPHFSTKTFEQAAGFLRIPESSNPLDNTAIHPERYPLLEQLASKQNVAVTSLMGSGAALAKSDPWFKEQVGQFTLEDIVRELEKPGRDIRDTFVPFQYREDIHELKDLKTGMACPGIVTNVTNFGAFVDIGVHQDGLVHLSQLSDRFVRDPREVVSPGDRVTVRVIEINLEKNQIALTMRSEKPQRAPTPVRREEHRPPRRDDRPRSNAHNQGQGQKATQNQNRGDRGPKRPSRPTFSNNAFAALAVLKNQTKR